MSGYTVVNLKEVEDQAPNFGLSPDLEARFARVALEARSEEHTSELQSLDHISYAESASVQLGRASCRERVLDHV